MAWKPIPYESYFIVFVIIIFIDVSSTRLPFLTEVIAESHKLDHPEVSCEDRLTGAGVVTEAPALQIDIKVSYDSLNLLPKK